MSKIAHSTALTTNRRGRSAVRVSKNSNLSGTRTSTSFVDGIDSLEESADNDSGLEDNSFGYPLPQVTYLDGPSTISTSYNDLSNSQHFSPGLYGTNRNVASSPANVGLGVGMGSCGGLGTNVPNFQFNPALMAGYTNAFGMSVGVGGESSASTTLRCDRDLYKISGRYFS